MLERYYRINQAIGIAIHILRNGEYEINACEIIVNSNQLSIERKTVGLTDIKKLTEYFPQKSIVVALNLSGKGVLQKQTEKLEGVTHNNFNKILPSAQLDDFYVQNFVSGDKSFVSAIRNTDADGWIEQLTGLGFVPVVLSLGPFAVQHIIPQLNIYDSTVQFAGHVLQRNEQTEWVSYVYEEGIVAPFPLKIESEGISENLVIPYAAAFQLVLESKIDPIKAAVVRLETTLSALKENKKFKVRGALILGVFFMLLLINFIVFSWLNTANTKLVNRVSQSNQGAIDYNKLDVVIKQKEALLRNLGWDGDINKSALVDQVAALMPAELTLDKIEVNPVDVEAGRIQKNIVFMDRQLILSGYSEMIIPVNEWIARIKTKSWVKDIQLVSYLVDNEKNTGNFTIKIKY